MRHKSRFHAAVLTAMLALGASAARAQAPADSAGHGVARISLINGDVSIRRGDSGDWVAAGINAPLVVQDSVSTGPNSRAEVQFDWGNLVRLGPNTEVRLTDLEERRYQMQIARGSAIYRVLRDTSADVEVDTPTVSVRPAKRGSYRVTVLDDGETEVTARSGEVEIYTPRGNQIVHAGQTLMVRGNPSDPEFQIVRAVDRDELDRWSENRDHALGRSRSYQYVSRDIYGADDLDPYGRWVYSPEYGWVWAPDVAPGWAPYRTGRWSWIDWYGWSWVAYEPWGWAPYHYGRWFYWGNRWCWYPGHIASRHYWAPGLVAFFGFGGAHVGFGFGNVGWVPLAPYEVYRPWYGRSYYGAYRGGGYIDRSVHITNVNITNIYRNARVGNGVTAVAGQDFAHGRYNNYARVTGNELRQASLVRGQLPVAPAAEHLRFSDRQVATGMARTNLENRQFFTHRQPSQVDRVSFAEQQRTLQQAAGRAFGNASGVPASPMQRNAEQPNGWHHAAAPATGQASGAPDTARGWRRFGDRQTGSATAPLAGPVNRAEPSVRGQRTGDRSATAAPSAPAPAVNRGESSTRWQRFGDRPAVAPASPATGPAASAPAVNRGESSSRWQRFSERPAAAAPAENRSQRFGTTPTEPRSIDHGRTSSGGWSRFGDPRAADPAPGGRSVEIAPRMQRNFEGRSVSRPIQIAPPVVRERSAGGGGMRSSAPAPRAQSGGGGGGARSSGGGGRSGGGRR